MAAITEKERIVREGYDRIAEEYDASRSKFDHSKELNKFVGLLPKNARVLDVGCGAGVPVAKFLVESGFKVVGIDFSDNMLKLARKNVPKAVFIEKDMNKLDFAVSSFDGLTAFYSIIHVPKEKHSQLFESFHRILKPE